VDPSPPAIDPPARPRALAAARGGGGAAGAVVDVVLRGSPLPAGRRPPALLAAGGPVVRRPRPRALGDQRDGAAALPPGDEPAPRARGADGADGDLRGPDPGDPAGADPDAAGDRARPRRAAGVGEL